MTPNDEHGAPADVEDEGREELRKLEDADEVPSDPKDWPDGPAKFLTYDNEGEEPYGEGKTAKLGPAGVVHHEDGSVTIDGEPVDDPSQFKGDPIPGGPTDPNAERIEGEG
jgi:hypothetical protein